MKNYSLRIQCLQLYKQMLKENADCERRPSGEAKWIELGYGSVVQSWFRVERMADGYQFVSDEEEISFQQIMQSRFAGWMNFLQYYTDPLVAAG
jgi:hypothetical protein